LCAGDGFRGVAGTQDKSIGQHKSGQWLPMAERMFVGTGALGRLQSNERDVKDSRTETIFADDATL
jgi:hypothetical protein